MQISQLLQKAIALHQSGKLQEAEAIYKSILQKQPIHSDALHLSGLIAHQTGKNEIAIDLFERLIKTNPNVSEFHNSCGSS